MKKMLLMVLSAIALPAAVACAPEPDVSAKGCGDYYAVPNDTYTARVILTDPDTDEVIRDGQVFVLMYPSGGAGASWGGVAGTAVAEHVRVDYEINFFGSTLELTGVATDEYGSFLQVQNGRRAQFEFSEFEVYDQKALTTDLPLLDLTRFGGNVRVLASP